MADEVQSWLEREVEEFRVDASEANVRLSRLTQELPSSTISLGWLIEVTVADEQAPQVWRRLRERLRDMRLLGLAPKVLAPVETNQHSPWASGNGLTRAPATAGAEGV